MEKIWKIVHKGKEISVLDYSGCKPDKMIKLFMERKRLVQAENKPVLVLSIFKDNYVTPEFMRVVEKGVQEIESLIERNAIIGLSEIQKWILKGMNLWYKKQVHHFDSYDEALDFLVGDNHTSSQSEASK